MPAKPKNSYMRSVKVEFTGCEMSHILAGLDTHLRHVSDADLSDREHGEAEKAAWAADVLIVRGKVAQLLAEHWG